MTDNELKELVASLAMQSAKTDAQMAATTAQMTKTDAKLDKLAKIYGGVANNQGDVAEEFYFNSLKHNLKLGGIQYDLIEKNVTRRKDGVEDEYDILLVNGKTVYIIEVKYKVHENDLTRIINKKYPNFKKLYSEYATYKHILGIASFSINDELKETALGMGINVLQRKGDLIEEIAA